MSEPAAGSLPAAPPSVIGIDIGGSKIAAALITADGTVHDLLQVPTRAAEGPEALLARVQELIERLRMVYPAVSAIGIATAGQIDHRTGQVIYANENLPGWTGMPIAARIQVATGLPVRVDNDVHALALAEAHLGAGRGSRVLIVVAVGTGIGGALVVNGRLFRGAAGNAGELGHIPVTAGGPRCNCGNRGCLEAHASGPRIAAAYGRAAGHPGVDLPAVIAAAQSGDVWAIQVFARAGRLLGRGLAGLANALDPDCLVLGGGVLAAGDLLLAPFDRALQDHLLAPLRTRLAVHRSTLGPAGGVLGAALLVLRPGVAG